MVLRSAEPDVPEAVPDRESAQPGKALRGSNLHVGAARTVRRLLDRLPGGRFTRSVVVLAGGTALGQGLVVAASPILTRLYTPADFGTLGVFVSLLGLLAAVTSLRYELAIPLPEKDEDAAALVILSLAVIPITASTVGLGLWIFRDDVIHWTNAPALSRYMWLLPIAMAFMGMYQVFNYWAVRQKAFGEIARTKLHQAVVIVVTQLSLFAFAPLGLLLGQVIGSAAGTGTLAALAARGDRSAFRATDRRAVTRMAKRYRRFPQVSAMSGILNSGGLVLPTLLLAGLFGPLIAGQFALVQRVVTLPMSLLGRAVAQVYFGEGASALRSSPTVLHRLFLGTTRRLTMAAVAPMLVLLLAGPWLFPFVFGGEWDSAGQFSRVLAPMVAVQLVASPLSQTLNVLERQTWQLGWDVCRLALVVASFASAAYLSFSPIGTVALYAIAMFAGYVFLWLLLLTGIMQSVRESRLSSESDYK